MLGWLPLEVRDEGVVKGNATVMDFVGAGVSVIFVAGVPNRALVSIAGGAGGDLSMNNLAPTADVTLTAGYSATVERKYTIASGKKLTLGSASRFRIH